MIKKIQDFLNAHPKIKTSLIIAEGAAGSFIITQIDAVMNSGGMQLNSDVAKKFALGLLITVYLSVKNYWTTHPEQLPK